MFECTEVVNALITAEQSWVTNITYNFVLD